MEHTAGMSDEVRSPKSPGRENGLVNAQMSQEMLMLDYAAE